MDSILPIEEALRRFREGLREPAWLGGVSSLDALVTAFVRALERSDTAALVALAVDRAEFAYLVYPSSPYVAPPFRQAPGLVWMQIGAASRVGLARALRRFGDQPLLMRGYRCDGEPERQGINRVWRRCQVNITTPGAVSRAIRLFGDVVEREGRFKFVSFANDL